MRNDVHIGEIIKEVVKQSGRQHKWLANALNISRTGLYELYLKKDISTDQLKKFSELLNHDFFQYYTSDKTPSSTPFIVSERQETFKTLTKNGQTKAEVLITIRLTDGDGNEVLDTDFLRALDKFTRNYTEEKNNPSS